MDTNNFQNELNELKEQFAILNKKLENEGLVNIEFIRRIVAGKISQINTSAWAMVVMGFAATIFMPLMLHYMFNASIWFIIFTTAFLLIATIAELYSHIKLSNTFAANYNLMATYKEAAKLKKFNKQWLFFIGIPFLCVWLPWFYIEISRNYPHEDTTFIANAMAIGGVIGAILGIAKFLKEQRELNAIIEEIEEMQS